MQPDERRAIVLALAEDRIPEGITADSAQGRHYAAWAAAIRADVDGSGPMSEETRNIVVTLLRGGRYAA